MRDISLIFNKFRVDPFVIYVQFIPGFLRETGLAKNQFILLLGCDFCAISVTGHGDQYGGRSRFPELLRYRSFLPRHSL